jgi:membrane fusion protein (multidrug efflux system)
MRLSSFSLLLGVALLSACGNQTPPPAPMAPEVGVVTVGTAKVSDVRNLPGRTSAYVIAEVRPQVTGIVQARLFEEGAVVKAGQPLYQLDDAIYRAEVENRKATLARARATLEAAELSEKRTRELAQIDAVSTQDLENATAALAQARADVAAAEAALRTAEVNLSYARITSPITGRTSTSTVTQGALVTANQEKPLTTVQQLDPIYVDLQQSSAELLRLRQDFGGADLKQTAPVVILLENGTRYQHTGELKFSGVSVDPLTGSFSLRAVVPNPEGLLLPGMFVRAVLERGEREAVLVPQRAVSRDPKGNGVVMVVTPENVVEARIVSTSRTVADKWVIDSGLQAGERVIVEGLQKIQPGMTVKAVEAGVATEQRSAESAATNEAQ